ncbi:MAG TPA: nickel pincer cofactor biosynthesis protein LarC [Bryobacterales bacterium]|nr:nickel pincer cofactor biosynthesis protein LarC [Bryobacterales bacterium]
MKICYLDCFSGISGDMLLGALADAGADPAEIQRQIGKLRLEGVGVSFEKCSRSGIAATKLRVEAPREHHHRHLSHIEKIIQGAGLAKRVDERSLAVFRRLAEVEASIHQVPVEKVHFHEVGAVDSIVDIAGAAIALELLGIDRIHCSPLNLGSGFVECDHGTLPVPAPATAALVQGKPVYSRGPAFELTTPTGAAVAVTLAESFGPLPAMRIAATGYGAGDRDFPEQPNLLRVIVGEASGATEATEIWILEANLDDMSPQLAGYVSERLLEAGALDVTFAPVYMKKDRPGFTLSALVKPEDRERLSALLFAETTTLGIRLQPAERRVLERSWVEVETGFGAVRVKVARDGGRLRNFAPEYEDCRRLAREKGVPLKEIIQKANFAFLQSNPEP